MRLMLATFLLGGASGLMPAAASAQIRSADGNPSSLVSDLEFDIPAQSLQSALERYSVLTGMSVIYLGTLALGRTSAAVKGRYSADAALKMLIEGTGLTVSYTTAESFILVSVAEGERAARGKQVPVPDRAASYDDYYGAVQADVRDVLCSDARIAPDNFRAALQFWVDPAGQVTQVSLLDTTGSKVRDSAIVDALYRTAVHRPPPELEQPFTMLILPRAAGRSVDCHAD